MSNFGKIKNIWNLDVVSREEMKTILQEWDDALTSLQNDVNEVKRLTTLKSYYETNGSIKINNNTSITLNDLDDSKPMYFAFLRRNSGGTYLNYYSYTVRMKWYNTWLILNENINVKLRKENNKHYIDFQVNNPTNGDYFSNLSINYTPKTLNTTLETQEEGEAWEISK